MLDFLINLLCCKICSKNKEIDYFNYKDIKNKRISIKNQITDIEERLLKPMDSDDYLNENLKIKKCEDIKLDVDHCILKRHCDPKKYYQWDDVDDEIGRGSFGVVYKIKSILFQQIRAMKKICKSGLEKENNKNSFDFLNEIRILRNLDHPNIIKIYEIFEDQNFFYIVTDYFSQGNFLEKILKMNDMKNEIFIGLMMLQILSAVCYLHKNNIIHGDLKPENIMMASDENIYCNFNRNTHNDKDNDNNKGNNINNDNNHKNLYRRRITFNTSINMDLEEVNKYIRDSPVNTFKKNFNNYKINRNNFNNNNSNKEKIEEYLHYAKNFEFKNLSNFHIKLIDFGCSKILSKKHYKYDDLIGTVSYMAPEVALNKYNEKCDIWSCGVIMFVLLTGEFPFEGETKEETENNIINYKFNLQKNQLENISNSAIDLLKLLLTYDPNERISAKDALNHPFFTDNFNKNNIFNEKINCEETLKNIKNYLNYYYRETNQNENAINYNKIKNNKGNYFLRKFMDSYMSYNLINSFELENIMKVFKLLDDNNDGMLSISELISAFKKFKIEINEEQIYKFLKEIKHKDNELIEYEEFVKISSDKKKLFSDENLKIAFETLDEDKNGFITKLQLKNIFFDKFDLSDDIFNEFFLQFNSEYVDRIYLKDFLKAMK
jgi:serine/threonine protein kinase